MSGLSEHTGASAEVALVGIRELAGDAHSGLRAELAIARDALAMSGDEVKALIAESVPAASLASLAN